MTTSSDPRGLKVVRAGALTMVQDAGRPGFAHLGVPRSGALDRAAMAEANRLVGNRCGTAVLETTLTGVGVQALSPCVMAVVGPPAPLALDGRSVDMAVPLDVPAGAVLDVGSARSGVRSYVAVAGGIDVEPVLGSRSTDRLSGLGPPVVRDADILRIGPVTSSPPAATTSAVGAAGAGADLDRSGAAGPVVLALSLGPRDDWFTPAALAVLLETTYRVSSISNRVAIRLEGPALARSVTGELPSEGLVLGAVQVPADGRPLIFLADHPTTGGYPVIAVVHDADVDRCAQARPGSAIRFQLV